MNVQGKFTVECNNCHQKTTFKANETDFENFAGGERQMGPENGYVWETTFNCDCNQEIELRYEAWEYPMGAFNNCSVEITGADYDDKLDIDFQDSF